MNSGILVKCHMNHDEIQHWLNNQHEYFKHIYGSHNVGKWRIHIINKQQFQNIVGVVYGYNGIKFGEIYVDNSFRGDGVYGPIIKFHNALQGYAHGGGRITSNGLSKSIYPKDEPITLEMLHELVNSSWDIVKAFLNQ